MNDLIAIGLSPNTEADDVLAAKNIVKNSDSWTESVHVKEVTTRFKHYLGAKNLLLTSSGRSALYSLLKAYGIGRGDEVIIQAFTCIAVPEPILWVNAKPVYVDIETATYSMNVEDFKKKITDKTKAVIVQHTFGIPGNIQQIIQIARQHSIVVIEDCAHALGSTVNGNMVGTMADAAIFSFGRDKTLSSVYGGAVSVKDDGIFKKVLNDQNALRQPPQEWIREQLRHPIVFDIVKRWYTRVFIGKLYMRIMQSMNLVSKAVELKERTGEMPQHISYAYSPALAQLLQLQIKKLDSIVVRRKEIVKEYIQAFNDKGFAAVENSEAVLMRFPLLVSNRAEVLKKAKQKNIILGDWYDAALVPSDASFSTFGYKQGSCPVAEEVATQVINLPTYHSLSEEDVKRVIEVVTSNAKPV